MLQLIDNLRTPLSSIKLPICSLANRWNLYAWKMTASKFSSTFDLGHLAEAYEPDAASSVVDYGCGTGRLSDYLRKDIGSVALFDVSRNAELLAKERYASAGFAASSLCESSLLFDTCYLVGVLSSVIGAHNRKRQLVSIGRLLKPGGYIVFGDFGRSDFSDRYRRIYQKSWVEPRTYMTKGSYYIHHFDMKELNWLFEPIFEVVEHVEHKVTSVNGNSLNAHTIVARVKR